ncbi:nuclear pore-associated protein 1-like, partial [Fukomys damarensis]|uniref:nuclear pore-associated protein 1-like n=1 Tax=Fukomys damarensis TaxID=885580 RepID=UPI001455D478
TVLGLRRKPSAQSCSRIPGIRKGKCRGKKPSVTPPRSYSLPTANVHRLCKRKMPQAEDANTIRATASYHYCKLPYPHLLSFLVLSTTVSLSLQYELLPISPGPSSSQHRHLAQGPVSTSPSTLRVPCPILIFNHPFGPEITPQATSVSPDGKQQKTSVPSVLLLLALPGKDDIFTSSTRLCHVTI